MKNARGKNKNTNGRLEAALFDMDGTLVSSELDFEAIHREAGIESGLPILEHMETADEAEAMRITRVLEEHEERAAEKCLLADGVKEVFAELERLGVKRCILTRNSRKSAATAVRRHGLHVDAVVAREDAPPKPSPEPVYLACGKLGASPARSMVIGDYKFDIQSGKNAGALTAWLRLPGRELSDVEADFEIGGLRELIPIIKILTDGRDFQGR